MITLHKSLSVFIILSLLSTATVADDTNLSGSLAVHLRKQHASLDKAGMIERVHVIFKTKGRTCDEDERDVSVSIRYGNRILATQTIDVQKDRMTIVCLHLASRQGSSKGIPEWLSDKASITLSKAYPNPEKVKQNNWINGWKIKDVRVEVIGTTDQDNSVSLLQVNVPNLTDSQRRIASTTFDEPSVVRLSDAVLLTESVEADIENAIRDVKTGESAFNRLDVLALERKFPDESALVSELVKKGYSPQFLLKQKTVGELRALAQRAPLRDEQPSVAGQECNRSWSFELTERDLVPRMVTTWRFANGVD